MRLSYRNTSADFWCRLFGYTRQNFYKAAKREEKKQLIEEIVLQLISPHRKLMPRVGLRKLLHLIEADLKTQKIKLGRDKFADMLRDNNLLIKAKRSYTKTTITNQWRTKYDDLRIDYHPTESERLWVADITYIRTLKGFEYLSLITDDYSKKIVGWCMHPTLETDGCRKALKMALKNRKFPDRDLIHHSDRGVQYCSIAYTGVLVDHKISISVTQNGSPYENPVAESMNSILKVELDLDQTYPTRKIARKDAAKKIKIYNQIRPHGSLDYMTPDEAYNLQERSKNDGRIILT